MTTNKSIRWSEFGHQLLRIGALQDVLRHPVRPKIAIGVSGGADSMALAYLLHHFEHPENHKQRAFDVYSFIVDHGARAESRDEALLVKRNLDNFGIRSEILSINWPQEFDPTTSSAFEEKSRTARYDLIMNSALRHGCHTLFTGHHLDDNIETLLFRLARNKSHPLHSMCGIQDKSLPPCEHTFGVNGYSEALKFSPEKTYRQRSSRSDVVVLERPHTGAILYRPLLSFPKSRILATCASYDIPYVDDKTNHDPMFATRNTVRYMRKSSLPQALQAPRLLALRERAHDFLNTIESSAKDLCQKVSKLHVYTQTGTVEIKAEVPLTAVSDYSWQYFMARIIELVAPQTGTAFPALISVPKMQEMLRVHESSTSEPVMFRKSMIHIRRTLKSDVLLLHLVSHRQPLSNHEIKDTCQHFILDRSLDTHLFVQKFSSKYVLWDDRFWVSISCPNRDAIARISIRAYQADDIKHIKNALSAQKRHRQFDRLMTRFIPSEYTHFRPSGKAPVSNLIRHTLPVLVYDDHVVAFPTLDFSVQPELVPQLSWQVKYRRADRVLDFFAAHFRQTQTAEVTHSDQDTKKDKGRSKQDLRVHRIIN